MMVHLTTSHGHIAGLRSLNRCSHGICSGHPGRSVGGTCWCRLRTRTTGSSHVVWRRVRDLLSIVDLGHSPHASTSKFRILIAVPPTIHCPLDESSLSSKTRVELRKRPSNGIAFRLVDQSVAAILVFPTARSRIDAVLRFELAAQILHVHGLDIASDGIFHLDTIARVLKGNPLHAVVVLPNNQRCRGRYRPWSCVGVDPAWLIWMHSICRRRTTRGRWCSMVVSDRT